MLTSFEPKLVMTIDELAAFHNVTKLTLNTPVPFNKGKGGTCWRFSRQAIDELLTNLD